LKVFSEFVTSAAGAAGFPTDGVPELAMVGRSNVGKSTLINALVRQKLARTSAAPGEKSRQEFDALAAEYFSSRHAEEDPDAAASGRKAPRFCGVLSLVDSRHPGLDADRITWTWLSRMGIERHVVATKVDKLTRAERHRHLSELERLYSMPVTPVSAETGEGLDALWTKIATLTTTPR